MGRSLLAAVVVSTALPLATPEAAAQDAFVSAVRELAATASLAGSSAASSDVAVRRAAAVARLRAVAVDWDRALDALAARVERGLRGAGSNGTFQLHIELGIALYQRGRLQPALKQFDAAAAVQPRASDVHVLRAMALDGAGRHAEADQAYRTAWQRDRSNPVKALHALNRTLEPAERARGLQVLRDALERVLSGRATVGGPPFVVLEVLPDTLTPAPVVGDAAMGELFAALAAGRLDDALAIPITAEPVAAHAGGSPKAHFERARADEAAGRLAEARQAYAAAVAGTLSGRHMLYVAMGRLAHVEGELDDAIDAFTKAVRLNPNDRSIRRELAAALAEAGRTEEAFAALVAALLIDPQDGDALAAIGGLFLDTDRPAEAIPVFRRLLAIAPGRFEARYALGTALSRTGRPDAAAHEFEQFERANQKALDERRREVTGQAGPTGVRR